MELKKVDKTVWGPDVTLGSLWQEWARLNRLNTIKVAEDALRAHEIRTGGNLASWLKDTPTTSLLTSMVSRIREVTGIDIDGWMVCDAKRQVITAHPELATVIDYDRLTSRKSLIAALNAWKSKYGGTHFLALQMQISPQSLNQWSLETNLPTLEHLPKLILWLAQGFLEIDCQEDVIFILMCRAIIGTDPQGVFDNIRSFAEARDALFRTYPGHTLARIAEKTGIPTHRLDTLKNWSLHGGKARLPGESIEAVVRALIKIHWPSLVEAFDERAKVYKKDEVKGIWAVEQPLLHLIEATRKEPVLEESRVDPPSLIPSPEPPSIDPPKARVSQLQNHELPQPKPTPVQTPCQTKDEQPSEWDPKLNSLRHAVADIFAFAAERLREDDLSTSRPTPVLLNPLGARIGAVEQCLDRASFTPRPGERLSRKHITRIQQCVAGLRGIFVMLCELDPAHIREDIRPILGPEIIELFLGVEGLKHLLNTQEAWRVIEAMREATGIIRVARVSERGKRS